MQKPAHLLPVIDYRVPIYLAVACMSVLAPIFVVLLPQPWWLNGTYGKDYFIYELFGISGTLALTVMAFAEFRNLKDRKSWQEWLPLLTFLAVGFYFLQLIVEYSFSQQFDYRGYENGAQLVLAGQNPYTPRYYVYPPLMAEVMAKGYRILETMMLWNGTPLTDKSLWNLIYYVYQAMQFWIVVATFWLCRKFLAKLNVPVWQASLLVAMVLLCNNPLLRTLRHHQVNLWVMDLTLVAAMLGGSFPFLAGVAAAVAVHIKIYPIILGWPWLFTRNIRAIIGMGVGVFGIVILQTKFFTDTVLWEQYIEIFLKTSHHNNAYRDNSLHSFLYNMMVFFKAFTGFGEREYAKPLVKLATVTMVILMSRRLWMRERFFANLPERNNAESLRFRLYAQMMDTLVLMLLVSPLVWEHHYVLAIPVILWAMLVCDKAIYFRAILGAALILLPPTFDVFLLSYHRVFGLIILLSVMPVDFRALHRLELMEKTT